MPYLPKRFFHYRGDSYQRPFINDKNLQLENIISKQKEKKGEYFLSALKYLDKKEALQTQFSSEEEFLLLKELRQQLEDTYQHLTDSKKIYK